VGNLILKPLAGGVDWDQRYQFMLVIALRACRRQWPVIMIWKKSTFPPSIFTKVRFSSLNSKTG
jgi:hypothetical protein